MNDVLRKLVVYLGIIIFIGLVLGILAIGVSIAIPILLVGLLFYAGLQIYVKSPFLQRTTQRFSKKGRNMQRTSYYEVDEYGNKISEQTVVIIEPDEHIKKK